MIDWFLRTIGLSSNSDIDKMSQAIYYDEVETYQKMAELRARFRESDAQKRRRELADMMHYMGESNLYYGMEDLYMEKPPEKTILDEFKEDQKIYKYLLDTDKFNEVQTISIPKGARILKVDWQRCNKEWDKCNLCIWAMINPEGEKLDREFWVATTGELIPGHRVPYLKHVDTVQIESGQFVAHVFEIMPYVTGNVQFYGR